MRCGRRSTITRLLAVIAAVAAVVDLTASPTSASPSSACGAQPVLASQLTSAFAAHPDGLDGGDYQRAISLPDGRTLWVLQDAVVARPGAADALVHNVGVVQDGSCL